MERVSPAARPFLLNVSLFLSHSQEKKMSQQIEEEETTDISQHQVRVAVRVRPLLDPSTEKSVAETFPSKIKVTHEGRSREILVSSPKKLEMYCFLEMVLIPISSVVDLVPLSTSRVL